MRRIHFSLEPVPPFRLDLTVWALRRRAINAMDRWENSTYRRVIAIGDSPAEIAVTQQGATLNVTATGDHLNRATITAALERLLGLRVDLGDFYFFAARHPRLDKLAQRFLGLKPPRFSVFEALLNGITCQQLSLHVGIILLNRLSRSFGLPFDSNHAVPRPEDLAGLHPEELRPLGYSGAKSRAMIDLSQAVIENRVDLESLAALPDDEALSRLLDLRGVGRWTGEYVLLRGLGRTNLFPGDDVGARNNLARWLKLEPPLDYDRVGHVLRKWRGYGGLIYFHLLLDSLENAGLLTSAPAVRDAEAL